MPGIVKDRVIWGRFGGPMMFSARHFLRQVSPTVLKEYFEGRGASVPAQATAAGLKSIATKENKTIISLLGDIIEGDGESLRQAIQSANATGKLVSAVRLSSAGGVLIEAIKIVE